jgi:hypothetical protein
VHDLELALAQLDVEHLRLPAAAEPGHDDALAERVGTGAGELVQLRLRVRARLALVAHRRISLLHRQGGSWAEIARFVGQRKLSITADTYTRVLVDGREADYAALVSELPDSARAVLSPVLSSSLKTGD